MAWNYGPALYGYPDQTQNLKAAMIANPNVQVFVAQGLYDLTTPFYGEEYSYRHLGLPDNLRHNWSFHTYEGGHMMYFVPDTHAKLCTDISAFLESALAKGY